MVEWKYVWIDSGEPFVTIHGQLLMQRWSADKPDSTAQVITVWLVFEVCIMITYHICCHKGAIARGGAYFGQGSVPVHFDSLTCIGNENSVLQCSFSGGSSCTHSLDVGVQCPG